MSIITRADGVKFAINNYREVLITKKAALLRKELSMLSSIHGRFAKLTYRSDGSQIESVFSPEQGYLLGLCIWAHFSSPDNLVYCEALENSDKVLLVIIHDKQLYLETETLKSNIMTELASLLLLNTKNKFDIYLYGDVPISQSPETGKFAFEGTLINSFNILSNPVFPTLQVFPQAELLPFKQALAELHLPANYTKYIFILLLIALVAGYLWRNAHPRETQKYTSLVKVSYVDPYRNLESALSTPSPEHILIQITDRIDNLLTLPAWQLLHITYNNSLFTASIAAYPGSTLNTLLSWANKSNYEVQFSSKNEILLKQQFYLPARYATPETLTSATQTYTFLFDKLNQFFPSASVQLTKMNNHNVYKEFVVSITMNNVSNTLLRQIARVFRNEPVSLNTINLDLNGALVSGTINFSVLGE